MIAWLTEYNYWLLLRNFAPVLVWNSYGDCLTDYIRLLAFAAKLSTSFGVKLLRWLPDWLHTTIGFCCETFITSSDVKLLRWLPDWLRTTIGFCCETFSTSSEVKLLRWLPDWLRKTTGSCCETFAVTVLRHTTMVLCYRKKWVSTIITRRSQDDKLLLVQNNLL